MISMGTCNGAPRLADWPYVESSHLRPLLTSRSVSKINARLFLTMNFKKGHEITRLNILGHSFMANCHFQLETFTGLNRSFLKRYLTNFCFHIPDDKLLCYILSPTQGQSVVRSVPEFGI